MHIGGRTVCMQRHEAAHDLAETFVVGTHEMPFHSRGTNHIDFDDPDIGRTGLVICLISPGIVHDDCLQVLDSFAFGGVARSENAEAQTASCVRGNFPLKQIHGDASRNQSSARFRATSFAAMMPTSYSRHIGIASISWEITSGGVTIAAITKTPTIA